MMRGTEFQHKSKAAMTFFDERSKDMLSLSEMFKTYYNELFYYGLKLGASDELVKDTIQDLFVFIAEKNSFKEEVRNIKAYLIVSLRRQLLKNLKKQRSLWSNEVAEDCVFDFSSEDFLISKESNAEMSEQLSLCFRKLSSRQREVILLRFYHEIEIVDIANIMEMNVQSTRNLLFRALEKIRSIIKKTDNANWDNIDLMFFLFTVLNSNRKKE
ncbi:sigma-70 family RNA polymerase sigma factor [Puteibacter caeruleilacunae]|nr:sigma-70 family RNA polymerase sigma factor [Puteibacter caeruleilacunae]